jgi:hypothetical protein
LLFEHFMFLYEAALVMRVPSNTWGYQLTHDASFRR